MTAEFFAAFIANMELVHGISPDRLKYTVRYSEHGDGVVINLTNNVGRSQRVFVDAWMAKDEACRLIDNALAELFPEPAKPASRVPRRDRFKARRGPLPCRHWMGA